MNTQFLQGTEALLTGCYINRVHFVVENVPLRAVQAGIYLIKVNNKITRTPVGNMLKVNDKNTRTTSMASWFKVL